MQPLPQKSFGNSPLVDIPENAHAMMPQHRVSDYAMDTVLGYVIRIYIAYERICRILGKLFLEEAVILAPLIAILGLARFLQEFVYPGIGISRVVGRFLGTKNLICMIISIKRTAPADKESLLPVPVDLGGNLYGAIHSCLAQLLGSGLGNIQPILLA